MTAPESCTPAGGCSDNSLAFLKEMICDALDSCRDVDLLDLIFKLLAFSNNH